MSKYGDWIGGRNHGQDLNGEMSLAPGYTFKQELFRSDIVEYQRGPAIVVYAEVHISANRTTMMLKVSVTHNYAAAAIIRRSCNSLSHALRTADQLLRREDFVLQQILEFYKRRIDVELEDGTQFATLFMTDYFYLPCGNYVGSEQCDGGEYRFEIRRTESSYGTSPIKETDVPI